MPDAGRVIAGIAAGRRLDAPGEGTRPLADRVKQTLFAILEPDLPGAAFLDLFAGSGAAGIEALSRGAASATFVERDPGAIGIIEANLRTTGLGGPTVAVIRADALAWLAGPHPDAPGGPFDLVVVDPPYAEAALLGAILERLGAPDAPLRAGARVVSKHFWRDRPAARIGLLASDRERRFGETALTFHRRLALEDR
jgi:16S rRNA (guanine966-N2)-methyltransferase